MRVRKKIIAIVLLIAFPFVLLGCSFDGKQLLEGKNPINNLNKNKDSNTNSNNEAIKDTLSSDEVSGKGEEKEKTETKETEQVKEKKVYRIYYYDIDYNIYYFDKEVEVVDKGVVKALTKELTIAPNTNLKSTLPSGIEVRKAKVEDGVLTVEFGSDFYDKVKLGSGAEGSMIQCLVNTYGYNLGVDHVIIKVNGKNYGSGHIVLEDGKSFTVDYSKAKPGK